MFYDGGVFNNPTLMVPGSTAGDIPLATGALTGDGSAADHWETSGLLGSTTPIGIMDEFNFSGGSITAADTRAMEVLGWNTVGTSGAGTWKGITLTQYSNDRNVAVVNELESSYTGSTGDTNGTPVKAIVGHACADQLNGDETRRLGFVVNGSISYNNPSDQDVYSFQGTAGTQVWFQISNTSPVLDTELQLVDANGNVLATSNNSYAESTTAGLLASEQPTGSTVIVNPLQLGSYSQNADGSGDANGVNADLYSKNVKDAGMRLILPGTLGASNTYYIRVSSNGGTVGQYQLQVRLQEEPEVPGPTVQFADIRDATTAVDVQGLPDSSPLTSTSAQVFNPAAASPGFISNTTFDSAQDLGNLLTSDQNMVSVSSQLLNAPQVQWYKFTLTYADIQSIVAGTDADKSWSTIFDVDYAGGVSRPDLTLSVFDSLGNLIYISRNSSVTGDQPTPTATGESNLSSGSSSPLDPFLGTVQLPVGTSKTYYVAISSDAMLPTDLSQTFLPAAGSPEALANPTLPTTSTTASLLRLEPVDSMQLIVNDHLDVTVTGGSSTLTTAPSNPSGGYTTSDGTTVPPATTAILPIQNGVTVANPNTSQPGTVINQLKREHRALCAVRRADTGCRRPKQSALFPRLFSVQTSPTNVVNSNIGTKNTSIGTIIDPTIANTINVHVS